jgi:hypothetical protein
MSETPLGADFRLGPSSADGLPGMARAKRKAAERAARSTERTPSAKALPSSYRSRRQIRWLWRWRPAWLPLLAGAALAALLWPHWPVGVAGAAVWLVAWRATPELWERSKMRRVGLAFRHRWDEAMRDLPARAPDGEVFGPGGMPQVRHQRARRWSRKILSPAVRVDPLGEVEATVFLPARFPLGKIDAGTTLTAVVNRSLRLPGGFGYPEWSVVYPKDINASAWWGVRVAYRSAPDLVPWGFAPAPSDSTLRLGCSAKGENLIDLLAVPHLRIYGPSRSGKGICGVNICGQACSAGWLVLIINSSGAPEWNPWANSNVPNVNVVTCSLRDQFQGAREFGAAMKRLLDITDARVALIDRHRVHSWAQLPDLVRAQHPRVLCMIDEPSALLKTAGAVGKWAGALLESVVRTGAKYGVTVVILDQLVNVSGSAITGPTIEQMRGWAWVGEQPAEDTRKRIGGFTTWPTTPKDKGGAVYARFGTPQSAVPIRLPYHSPEALEAYLAAERKAWPAPAPPP